MTSCCYLRSLVHCLQYQTSQHSLIQLRVTMSQAFLQSIHAIARLACLFLQSINTVLSMSGWSFVHNSLYGIFFVQIVLHSLFLSDHTSFQLTFQSLVSTSRVGRILVYNYQLHFLLPGLFGTVLSFQRSSNLARVFLHQRCDIAALLYVDATM